MVRRSARRRTTVPCHPRLDQTRHRDNIVAMLVASSEMRPGLDASANGSMLSCMTYMDEPAVLANTAGPCPVSERLAKQKFSTWGFPVNLNEAEFFCLVA